MHHDTRTNAFREAGEGAQVHWVLRGLCGRGRDVEESDGSVLAVQADQSIHRGIVATVQPLELKAGIAATSC